MPIHSYEQTLSVAQQPGPLWLIPVLPLHSETSEVVFVQERRPEMIEVTVADVARWADLAQQEEGEPGTEAITGKKGCRGGRGECSP